jgi:hypothetical protein
MSLFLRVSLLDVSIALQYCSFVSTKKHEIGGRRFRMWIEALGMEGRVEGINRINPKRSVPVPSSRRNQSKKICPCPVQSVRPSVHRKIVVHCRYIIILSPQEATTISIISYTTSSKVIFVCLLLASCHFLIRWWIMHAPSLSFSWRKVGKQQEQKDRKEALSSGFLCPASTRVLLDYRV